MKFLKEVFNLKWQLTGFLLCSMFFLFSIFALKDIFLEISAYALLFVFLLLLVSLFVQLFRKNWRNAFIIFATLSISVVILICSGFFLALVLDSRHDEFTDDLYIPKNIEISYPLDKPTVNIPINSTKIDFRLYNSFQPGLYYYEIYEPKLPQGKIYLKAYEVTKNQQLTVEKLKQRSEINIDGNTCFYTLKDHFTIYEGDWGKPYAARFEVWYQPNSEKKEKKLFEKNYVIEGWQR